MSVRLGEDDLKWIVFQDIARSLINCESDSFIDLDNLLRQKLIEWRGDLNLSRLNQSRLSIDGYAASFDAKAVSSEFLYFLEAYKDCWEGAFLRDLEISDEFLTEFSFSYADLRNSSFTKATLKGLDLRGADLGSATFSECKLAGCHFGDNGIDSEGPEFINCEFIDCYIDEELQSGSCKYVNCQFRSSKDKKYYLYNTPEPTFEAIMIQSSEDDFINPGRTDIHIPTSLELDEGNISSFPEQYERFG